MNHVNFCTCNSLECPMHPTKHDKGCTPCINKNLKLREIPSCFFNEVGGAEGRTSYHYEDFAEAVLGRKQEK